MRELTSCHNNPPQMTTKAAVEEEMVSSLNLTIAEKALQFSRKTPT
jgi:hypothetical protein